MNVFIKPGDKKRSTSYSKHLLNKDLTRAILPEMSHPSKKSMPQFELKNILSKKSRLSNSTKRKDKNQHLKFTETFNKQLIRSTSNQIIDNKIKNKAHLNRVYWFNNQKKINFKNLLK